MLPCGNLFVGFLRLGGFRQLQLEHALGKGCLDLVRVHSFRQLEDAVEGLVTPFRKIIVFLAFFLLLVLGETNGVRSSCHDKWQLLPYTKARR
jgi:hypothetical protein